MFARRFHTDVLAVVYGKSICTETPIICERRKVLAAVGGNTLFVGRSNLGIDKGLVNVHSVADWANDFRHKHMLTKKLRNR